MGDGTLLRAALGVPPVRVVVVRHGRFRLGSGPDLGNGTEKRIRAGARGWPMVKEAEKPGQQLGFDIGDRGRGGKETGPAVEGRLCRRGDGGGGL